MSGPKDYSPPPRYSMQVFEGRLNQIFQLQSRLKKLSGDIKNLRIDDHELNIRFDCKEEFSRIKIQVDDGLNALVFDYRGTFGQDVYDRISREVDVKIGALNQALSACEAVKINFADKQKDYESYLSYLLFHDTSKRSFEDFRRRILDYLKNNLESKAPEIFIEADKRISNINFDKPKAPFQINFTSKIESEKNAVMTHLIQKENEINRVRAEVSDKVIGKFEKTIDASQIPKVNKAEEPNELNEISEKIESLLRDWEDAVARKEYARTFQKLKESHSLSDIYFFKELHDSILNEINTRKTKNDLASLLGTLNTFEIHSSLQSEKQAIVNSCLNLLKSLSVSNRHVENLQSKFEQLKQASNSVFEEDEIKQREHLFLKSQIILCLENLGYEVMDDLEVIDFEKENDFLLKIRQQENYLNLKFKEDGSLRYVFQIPEKEHELSTDQKNLKLHEMQVTCDEFKSVLTDLSKMGLKINLRSERRIEVDSLVSVTESTRGKIKSKEARKEQKQTLRKKYLINNL